MKNVSELINDISNHGYVILKSTIDLDHINDALKDIAKIFQQNSFEPYSFSKALISEFKENNEIYRAKLRCIRSLISMMRLSDSYQRILFVGHKQSLGHFAAWPNLHLQHSDIIFKGGYDRLPPHQEYNYSRGSIDSLVAWSPLFAISTEHFPLEIIKGSHRKGLIPHKLIGVNTALDTLNSDDYKDEEFTRLELNVGDVVLFSSFLIHRTGKNCIDEVNPPVRIAANFQFNNLLEQSIISRSYQLSDSVQASAGRFDPAPFINDKNE